MEQLDLTPIWKALADSKRRRIVHLLHEKSRTTSEICTFFDVSRFAIMQHLKVLEQASLIKTRREGRRRWNSLNKELFRKIQQNYLESDLESEYQLGDILSLLSIQEGIGSGEAAGSEQRHFKLDVELRAPPSRIFRALTDEIDGWWSYRIVADSQMNLEPHVGGRFYEVFNGGGGALYALVTYLKPDEEIQLNGSMGLAGEGENNVIHISLHNETADSTLLRLSHHFLRRVDGITSDSFRRSWIDLLSQHLKAYVEKGTRYQSLS